MTLSQSTQFGPYRLLEQIGSGGMGEVYRALDTRLEREVALKLVSDRYLARPLAAGARRRPRNAEAVRRPAHFRTGAFCARRSPPAR